MDDVSTFSHRRLSTILRDPNHPHNSAAKAEMDRRKMQSEKTLTPAEKRKREKIAKAIERENPDMPMDKKMAIATATAKRVAEAAPKMKGDSFKQERDRARAHDAAMGRTATGRKKPVRPMTSTQRSLASLRNEKNLDEISSNTLGNYMRKSSADAAKSRGDARRQDKRIGGQKMADDKIRKKMGYSSQAKVPAGTNEAKVDEISMNKLSNYSKAAAKDIEQKRNKVKAALDQPASVKHAKAGMKAMQGLTKRSRGSDMYVNKMTGRSKVKPSLESIMKMIKK